MQQITQSNSMEVHSSEAGQKLLQFLVRRLNLPQPLLHRWIRTGQIRVNASRGKPFMHVQEGDVVRVPPFALGMAQSATFGKHTAQGSSDASPGQNEAKYVLPPQIYADENLIVFNKPQGLPVHAGTKHIDSLAARLKAHFPEATFKPTPAHRLDKDTSGILCVALSYAALRTLQDAFEQRTLQKEYLAWVHGIWQDDFPKLLSHTMAKKYTGYIEKMRVLPADIASEGHGDVGIKEAVSYVRCLQRTEKHSLMHIRLVTGRTHQIRVQLAGMGHPVLGDGKYGSSIAHMPLCLHALRLTFPMCADFAKLKLDGKSFAVLPTQAPWQAMFGVHSVPDNFPPME